MTTIRLAESWEFETVRSFYHTVIDGMKTSPYYPHWEKGIYPSDDDLEGAITRRELYIGLLDGKIVSAMSMNHSHVEVYDTVEWPTKAEPEEVSVIHMLCVHPDFGKRGIAKELLAHAVSLAKAGYQKAIRLDTLAYNLPAVRLYTSFGFANVATVTIYVWGDSNLFEYPIR